MQAVSYYRLFPIIISRSCDLTFLLSRDCQSKLGFVVVDQKMQIRADGRHFLLRFLCYAAAYIVFHHQEYIRHKCEF